MNSIPLSAVGRRIVLFREHWHPTMEGFDRALKAVRSEVLESRQVQALIGVWARRFARSYKLEVEDARQLVSIGFLKAIDRWDPDRGTFVAVARWYARAGVSHALGAHLGLKRDETNEGRARGMRWHAHTREGLTPTLEQSEPDAHTNRAAQLEAEIVARQGVKTPEDLVIESQAGRAMPDAVARAARDLAVRTVLSRLRAWDGWMLGDQHALRSLALDSVLLATALTNGILAGLSGRDLAPMLEVSHETARKLKDRVLAAVRRELQGEAS